MHLATNLLVSLKVLLATRTWILQVEMESTSINRWKWVIVMEELITLTLGTHCNPTPKQKMIYVQWPHGHLASQATFHRALFRIFRIHCHGKSTPHAVGRLSAVAGTMDNLRCSKDGRDRGETAHAVSLLTWWHSIALRCWCYIQKSDSKKDLASIYRSFHGHEKKASRTKLSNPSVPSKEQRWMLHASNYKIPKIPSGISNLIVSTDTLAKKGNHLTSWNKTRLFSPLTAFVPCSKAGNGTSCCQ